MFFTIQAATAYVRLDSDGRKSLTLQGTFNEREPAILSLATSSDLKKRCYLRDDNTAVNFPVTEKVLDDAIEFVFRALAAKSGIEISVYEPGNVVELDEDLGYVMPKVKSFEVESFSLGVLMPLPPLPPPARE